MSKKGIKMVEETVGSGATVTKTDRVDIVYDMQLSRGDYLIRRGGATVDLARRETIAGLRYGVEGMREGGTRKFKASPHLCYGASGVPTSAPGLPDTIPADAVLIITIKDVKILRKK